MLHNDFTLLCVCVYLSVCCYLCDGIGPGRGYCAQISPLWLGWAGLLLLPAFEFNQRANIKYLLRARSSSSSSW